MILQLLHAKSTSKNFSFLYVENMVQKERFTILWTRDRDGNGNIGRFGDKTDKSDKSKLSLVERLRVGDTFHLFLDKDGDHQSHVWKRPDLLLLPVDARAVLEKSYLDHNQTPFTPIPPPPKCISSVSADDAKEYCKHWIHARKCPFTEGDVNKSKCHRLHPEGAELKRIRDEWVAAKKSYRQSLTSKEDPHQNDKTSKASKARVFAEFLRSTFALNPPSSSLLDVAGGRGTISIELNLNESIKSIIVDPRDDCCRGLKYQERQLIHIPKSRRAYSHLKAWFDKDFPTRYSDIWQESTLLFGMHPDQATEPIVDMALKYGKPFATVPCCVFASENPNRKLKSGKPVVLYEDFIVYLMEKDPSIKKIYLPFQGKNVCLYKK